MTKNKKLDECNIFCFTILVVGERRQLSPVIRLSLMSSLDRPDIFHMSLGSSTRSFPLASITSTLWTSHNTSNIRMWTCTISWRICLSIPVERGDFLRQFHHDVVGDEKVTYRRQHLDLLTRQTCDAVAHDVERDEFVTRTKVGRQTLQLVVWDEQLIQLSTRKQALQTGETSLKIINETSHGLIKFANQVSSTHGFRNWLWLTTDSTYQYH